MLRKNVAGQFIYFSGVNATTGAALTGATFSVRRSIDGTFAAGGGTITEDTGLGFYKCALSQADTNGNDLAFFFTATNAIPVCINALTTAADPSDAADFGLTNLDAAVTSRMATYTQPTGFLAASFPGTVASTTNITAGTITTVTTLTNLPAVTSNWLTAAGIAAGALNGKGDWNVGKTGYALTATTGLGNQTSNITGNLSGSVGSVTGAVGSVTGAVGSVTGLTASNLDATISSRMATYTQPTGFLAATFPTGTVANTTNITAGTITTVTNLTNAPTVGDLTSTMKTSVRTEATGALATDTYAEPGQAAPAATATLAVKIGYLYKAWRNKSTQTATTYSLFADDTTTVDQKATVSDDATTFIRSEIATGP